MIRYPMIVPGTHPAADSILSVPDVYVEALVKGPTVGFAPHGKELWVDMPISSVGLLNDKELNPQYHYVGVLYEDRITLTDIFTRKGPLDHEAKFVEADRLGMECVQLLHAGALTGPDQLRDFLQQSPSGIVVKPINFHQQTGAVIYCEITPEMFVQGPVDDAATAPKSNLIEVTDV